MNSVLLFGSNPRPARAGAAPRNQPSSNHYREAMDGITGGSDSHSEEGDVDGISRPDGEGDQEEWLDDHMACRLSDLAPDSEPNARHRMTLPAGQCASIYLENDAEEELNKAQMMEDVEQDRSLAQNPEAFLAACRGAELERETKRQTTLALRTQCASRSPISSCLGCRWLSRPEA